MKKIVIGLGILLGIIQGENVKIDIKFYTQNNLMWLIDISNTETYLLKTIEELKEDGHEDMINQSYENYINKVNSDEAYKYNDWRLPSKDELLQLELKGGLFSKLFASKEKKNTQKCIDEDIFYDNQSGYYYTSTSCKDNGYYALSFDCLRFKENKILNSEKCTGVQISCHTGTNYIRLVRDIK